MDRWMICSVYAVTIFPSMASEMYNVHELYDATHAECFKLVAICRCRHVHLHYSDGIVICRRIVMDVSLKQLVVRPTCFAPLIVHASMAYIGGSNALHNYIYYWFLVVLQFRTTQKISNKFVKGTAQLLNWVYAVLSIWLLAGFSLHAKV